VNWPTARILEEAADARAYVYDAALLRARAEQVFDLVDDYAYPIKANPDSEMVRAALAAGASLDLCSRGDLQIAAECGADLSGCNFTSANLGLGLASDLARAGVTVDLDSMGQIETWVAAGGGDAGVRVCTADSHSAYGSKFGVRVEEIGPAAKALARAGYRLTTLHMHDAHADRTPDEMVDRILEVLRAAPREVLAACNRVNIGGGWPMPGGLPIDAGALAPCFRRLRSELEDLGFDGRLAAEPGEWAVGSCGWLPGRVVAVKPHPLERDRLVVVLDVATPVPCRPSRAPFAVVRDGGLVAPSAEPVECDIYGSANTGLDTIGTGVMLQRPKTGDVIAAAGMGAYARELTGPFNERPAPGTTVTG